ncbi:endocuticle structural glycoprotein ABD-4 [Dendroctonus ponderosae]|uniref:Uncharacterized protein n=1 Tax=Dendroctonus ponderosae TaxID=77166 RepID=U4UBH8_DENPD|nr:endocuticle structural glycoprotein ABD-4 [Dendroctonus ponderosae]ERL91284.1 hypothetical protein D910_08617 [Dendroctonus ponderosae]KAH1004887.1 hypothetical protein HUJ05_005653 [Dendroctonus ponderosae]
MISQLFFLSSLLALALAVPVDQTAQPVEIITQTSDIEPDGSFRWNFESSDGTKQEQSGSLRAAVKDEEGPIASVSGSVSWKDPEGNLHQLKYVADEKGFQAQGADIPISPPIPAEIAKALAFIAAHPEPEGSTEKA